MKDCKCPGFIYHDHGMDPCPRKVGPEEEICKECLERSKREDPLQENSDNIPE